MFDECFTREGASVLKEFLGLYDPPVKSEFLLDFIRRKEHVTEAEAQGRRDADWPDLLKDDDPDWVVVSFDRGSSGRTKSKGPPLHLVLPRKKITGVYLGGMMAQAPRAEKVRAICVKLPEIFSECPRAPGGTRFKINRQGKSFEFALWPVKKHENKRFNRMIDRST